VAVISGAIDLGYKTAVSAMTPLSKVRAFFAFARPVAVFGARRCVLCRAIAASVGAGVMCMPPCPHATPRLTPLLTHVTYVTHVACVTGVHGV
jgi:hypothetical protein